MSSRAGTSAAAQDARGERPIMPGTVWAVVGLMGGPAALLVMVGSVFVIFGLMDMHDNPNGFLVGLTAGVGEIMLIAAAIFGAIAWLAWMGWVVLPWLMVFSAIGLILFDVVLQPGADWFFYISAAILVGLAALLFAPSARAYNAALRTWRRLARPRDEGAVPAD